MRRLLLALVVLSLILTPTADASSPPLVVIVMENHEFSDIVGPADYLTHTFIPAGRLFTNYDAVSHPSLPNYLAMTSGAPHCSGCDPGISGPNLFHQLTRHGVAWKTYAESMPSPCYRQDSGDYARRHNPAVYYTNVKDCAANDIPYPSSLPQTLPAFTFVVPNLCNDMHSCSVTTGDDWLKAHVPAFLAKGAVVVITFDEGDSDTGGGGRVMTAEVGPGIPQGSSDGAARNHYSLLAGIERWFKVARLGAAKGRAPLPL